MTEIDNLISDGTPAQVARLLEKRLREIIPTFTAAFNHLPEGELKQLINNIAPGLIAYAMQLGCAAELMESNLLTSKPPQ